MNAKYPIHTSFLLMIVLFLTLGQRTVHATVPAMWQHDGDTAEHIQPVKPIVKDTSMPKDPITPPSPKQLPTPLYLKQAFPADTLQSFLKAYGKDSLVHLLDQRIEKARVLLVDAIGTLHESYERTELVLLSKQFKLGFDTIKPAIQDNLFFLKVYGRIIGNINTVADTNKMKTATPEAFHQLYTEDMVIPGKIAPDDALTVALPLSVVGAYANVSGITIETLYKFYSNYKFPPDRQALATQALYYSLSEFGKASDQKALLVSMYRKKLFDSLYQQFNFPLILGKAIKESNPKYFYTPIENFNRLLAYGLYFGDVRPETHGLDLMYLLAAQSEQGGWQFIDVTRTKTSARATLYGLWALCELRSKLR